MINRKILSQKRVVLVGLLFALRTSIVLADPAQSGNTVDGKVSFEGSSKLKSESGREAPSSPKTISGEVINITQPRQDNAMPQLGQGTPFDRDEVEEDEEIISLNTNGDEKVEVETSSPTTQFKDNKDGTVTDTMTGLMWTKNANLLGDTVTLRQALDYIERMNAGEYPGFGHTNWRLPNVRELQSLIDYRRFVRIGHVLLYKGHPFQNVQLLKFNDRSLPTYLTTSEYRWFKLFYCSLVGHNFNSCFGYLWPVRDMK